MSVLFHFPNGICEGVRKWSILIILLPVIYCIHVMKKSIILLSMFVVFAAGIGRSGVSQVVDYRSRHFTIERIADGVFAVIHKPGGYAICNSGIIDLGNKVLVFDTFLSPEAAEDLKAAAAHLTGKPVDYVINSHYHNDHIRGNQVFPKDIQVISTHAIRALIATHEPMAIEAEKDYAPAAYERYRKLIAAEQDPQKKEALAMWIGYYEGMIRSLERLDTRFPDLTFSDKLILYGTDRYVELIQIGPGHTPDDLVLFIPEDSILFAGDLVFHKMHPYLADGNPEKWKSALQKLGSMNISIVVPGHGPVGNTADIVTMQQYIDEVMQMAIEINQRDDTTKELTGEPVPPEFENWMFKDFFMINLRFLIDWTKNHITNEYKS